MKKNLLSLISGCLMFTGFISQAQPTLTASGMNPVLGNSFTINTADYVNEGNAGANQTWNLSSMTGTPDLTSYVSPASTPSGGSFPYATIAASASAGVSYYKTSTAALQFYGVSSGVNLMSYSNPEDFLHYPFTYNNTYTDSWAVQFQSGGYTFYRRGTTTVTADGWGTLTTPNGTYTNVLRIHYVQVYQDSAYIGMPYIINYNNNEYMWYKEGAHVQLATVYTLTTAAGDVTGGSYVSGGVGIQDVSKLILSSTIYPNPASNKANLEFTLTENQKVDVVVFNTMGQQVIVNQEFDGVRGENIMKLDVTGLQEGIYFADIKLNGITAESKRFVVTK